VALGAAPTARRLALDTLVEVDTGARANAALARRLAAAPLSRRDRAFATELVYGTLRMRRACDWLVSRHARGRLDRPVTAAVRMGAYQLAFLGTPAHAAVAATVAEVDGPGRRLVNAVLRRVAADLDGGAPRWPDPATRLSYPDWVVERLGADLGPADALAALEEMNRSAPVTVRPDGYAQDRASQMVAAYVDAQPGELVIDLCAAPGGKATAMAETGAGVVAVDIDPGRAEVVAANSRRLGTGGVMVVAGDGRRPPLRAGEADRVLVDAPCSGLGVLRRRPDARWRARPADVDRLAATQRQLLAAAAALARPGGLIVFSVCTLTRAETAAIDRWAAERLPDLVPLPPPGDPWRPAGRGALLLPQAAGTDGMFVVAFRRVAPLGGGPGGAGAR
jgi:16S rRNA (cytosine967-C5)-methyltransferase